ncbi:hypothetical protein DE146DRAFT_608478 [Phaeosphaeria sp. MPI-PUGE-AT-0046c]|nr:hypothetical protein DE146DRAFT_608478 [Phaeosphaeria sp. MPI-PUGE-AT-0046c]
MEVHSEHSKKAFRVVIVGAGIVGLSLSHALQLASIDHVVLERQKEIVSLRGAALVVFPGAARILDQFGILKDMQESTTPVQAEFIRWPDGSVNTNPNNHATLKEYFGIAPITLNRQSLLERLYDGLLDKSVVRTNARVERIEQDHNGVKVFMADGTFEFGDLVIGADGVHSHTRELMWDYSERTSSEPDPGMDRQAISTEYRAIYGVSDPLRFPSLGPAEVHICLDTGTSKLVFTQPGAVMWAVMYRDEYSQPPKPYQPDVSETEEVVKRFKDLKITEDITFEDLWVCKIRGGILNMEEGILEKWHSGRIVLVGDSAHKMTADIGMGANMAIESAAVLANVLQRAVAGSFRQSYHPTQPELSALFADYQSQRYIRVKQIMKLSGSTTRMRSYQSIWKRIWISHIATLPIMQKMVVKRMVASFANAPKLEYVKTRTINQHARGWRIEPENQKQVTSNVRFLYLLLLLLSGIAISYTMVS